MADGNPLTLGADNTATSDTRLVINERRNSARTLTIFSAGDGTTSPAEDVVALKLVTFGTSSNPSSNDFSAALLADSYVSDCIVARADAFPGENDPTPNQTRCAVRARAARPGDLGVYGENIAGGIGVSGVGGQTGVSGESTVGGIGVGGASHGGIGVLGVDYTGDGVSGLGRRGVTAIGTEIGVVGEGQTEFGATGVQGLALGSGTGNAGVRGGSTQGVGVEGRSVNYIGVYAEGGPGLLARGTDGVAARFDGNVFVEGSLIVSGAKSALVPHPDGSRRQLYALESPESWFEDFGEAMIQDGQAYVDIDPHFAALIRTDDYQVFLTPYEDCNGLYVIARKSTGFMVRELKKGTSTLSFGYRILGRRKDIDAKRLERVPWPEYSIPPEPPAFVRPTAVFEPPARPEPLGDADPPAQE